MMHTLKEEWKLVVVVVSTLAVVGLMGASTITYVGDEDQGESLEGEATGSFSKESLATDTLNLDDIISGLSGDKFGFSFTEGVGIDGVKNYIGVSGKDFVQIKSREKIAFEIKYSTLIDIKSKDYDATTGSLNEYVSFVSGFLNTSVNYENIQENLQKGISQGCDGFEETIIDGAGNAISLSCTKEGGQNFFSYIISNDNGIKAGDT